MKTNLRKARFKAPKNSSCPMCNPNKRGWEDKKTMQDLRSAARHEFELGDAGERF